MAREDHRTRDQPSPRATAAESACEPVVNATDDADPSPAILRITLSPADPVSREHRTQDWRLAAAAWQRRGNHLRAQRSDRRGGVHEYESRRFLRPRADGRT